MKFASGRVIYSLLFYVLLVLLVVVARPSLIFENDGSPKPFGVGGDQKTIYSLGVIVIVLAIISFYIFALLDIIFGR